MALETFELPMFPLGTVLMPGGTLPLHIFEERYQRMLIDVLESDRQFGVVLISRGIEVGGGEARLSVGTVARIEEYQRFDDGRAAVVTHGHGRFEVVDWLPDDPYPRAIVTALSETGDDLLDDGEFARARHEFEQLLAVAHRVGRLAEVPEIDWATDLDERAWQLARISPLDAHDQYTVLAEPTRTARLSRLGLLLAARRSDLELLGGNDV